MKNLIVFGLNGSKPYAAKIARSLGVALANATEQKFDDGELYAKSNVNVRNADVYVVASLYSDDHQSINEKIVNLLLFCGSLHDASAGRITAVIPYMGYSRQDRKTESRAPVTTKYMAHILQSVHVDRVLTLDIHSLAAFQNANDNPVDNLDTVRLFTDYLCGGEVDGIPIESHIENPLSGDCSNIVTLSPDIGGIPRMIQLQNALQRRLKIEIPWAVFDKRRIAIDSEDTVRRSKLEGGQIIGDVKGKRVIMYDDMIASGGTIAKAARAVEAVGGEIFAVCAAHGLFTSDKDGLAENKLSNVKRLVVTDSIAPWRVTSDNWKEKVDVISTVDLFAQAIRRTHEEGGSLSDLLKV